MPTARSFAQVDVFGTDPYLGNPVAVVLDAEGLSGEEMQRLATWTNLSETTFVLPPTHPDADYRLRIFTPGAELPFAGHPTLGSAHAWLEHTGRRDAGAAVTQECGAGLIELRRQDGQLSFAAPPTLRTGPLEESYVDDIVAAYGIDRRDVVAHQWADNGPGWAVLQLATAEEVLALEPDFARLPDAMVGAVGAYPQGSEYAYELRAFAPRIGVTEDPVCGSMNASVAQWLTSIGAAPARYRVSQGSRVGRAGSIHIAVDADGRVWVGGNTTTCIRGTVDL